MKQAEVDGGGGSESNTVNEGDYLLKTLENERNVYSTLLEDTSISYQQREILETKYEVIQEALGVAIIAAVIAAVGALILLIAKVMKSTSSASNTVKTKIKEVNKKLEDKIDEIKAEPNSYEGELGDDGLTDAQRAATDKALSKFDSNNNMSDEDHTEFERKFGKQKNNTDSQTNTDNSNKKDKLKTKRAKSVFEIMKERIDMKDERGITWALATCLDADPTFEGYASSFNYLMKEYPDFFVDDDGKFEFTNNIQKWNFDYWNSLKSSFIHNTSLKKFNHMKDVAKVFYKEKIIRLRKERGEHGKGDGKLTRSDISQVLKVRNKFKMELKKSIKEYTIIKDVFDKYKDEFKKLCEESFDNSFPGFSSMDLLANVNKECIREFERDTRITAMDNKSFDEYDDIKTVTYDDKNRYETSNKDYVKNIWGLIAWNIIQENYQNS